ncbi:glycoside hydrolase [Crassisporium funariophilum]|nr:glycoside hydrolase [Crassisporium funariophilum]
MKFATVIGLVLATQSVSAHYIFKTLVAGSKTSTKAVRQPQNNMPISGVSSSSITCNTNPSPADETVTVAAGDKIGFLLDSSMYHKGAVSIYLGQAPGSVENWDGSGKSWFKIAEWGATSFNPITFSSTNQNTFTTTIPSSVPSGDYLVRAEQIALHLGTGVTENFASCAQIRITGGGNGNPAKVSIPGYLSADDPSVKVNIYSGLTSYTVPGPAVYRG